MAKFHEKLEESKWFVAGVRGLYEVCEWRATRNYPGGHAEVRTVDGRWIEVYEDPDFDYVLPDLLFDSREEAERQQWYTLCQAEASRIKQQAWMAARNREVWSGKE